MKARSGVATPRSQTFGRRASNSRRQWTAAIIMLTAALVVGDIVANNIDNEASAVSSEFGTSQNLWISRDVLTALPTSGEPWDRLVADATGNWGSANIADQNSHHDVYTLAGALYAVRMNDTGMRNKVVTEIESAVGTEVGGRTLALARNLTGYVLAADLVGHNSAQFSAWVASVRFTELDGRTLISTHEDRPNNWGTHAGAARIAADRFLGDDADLAQAAAVFRGFLGDRSAYTGFRFGDSEWQADESAPMPINPLGSTKGGFIVDGAIVDDIRRCECSVTSPAPQENYQWEAMQGIVGQAELLRREGYGDAWHWSDSAIQRAVDFLYEQADFPAEGDDTFVTFLVDANLGTSSSKGSSDNKGKSIGYTGWTHGDAAASATVTIPSTTTTTTTIPVVTIPSTTTTPVVTILPVTTTTTTPATTTVPVGTVPPATITPPVGSTLTTPGANGSRLLAGEAIGSYRDTWTRGSGSHTVVETKSEGRGRTHDLAELRWTIPPVGGDQVLDVAVTVGPDSGDADADAGFWIEWSSNGSTWRRIALVAAGTVLDATVAIGKVTSDVQIRVVDSDRNGGKTSANWVSVDFLQIRART
jgi:hypothetical protein